MKRFNVDLIYELRNLAGRTENFNDKDLIYSAAKELISTYRMIAQLTEDLCFELEKEE